MNILMTYLVLISPITFFLGFWIGRKYGWNKRDNIERMADLNREKEKVSKLSEKLDNLLLPKIKKMEFNIIGVRIKEDKKILTLEEELKEALDNEDYERAAEIKKKIDDKK